MLVRREIRLIYDMYFLHEKQRLLYCGISLGLATASLLRDFKLDGKSVDI